MLEIIVISLISWTTISVAMFGNSALNSSSIEEKEAGKVGVILFGVWFLVTTLFIIGGYAIEEYPTVEHECSECVVAIEKADSSHDHFWHWVSPNSEDKIHLPCPVINCYWGNN